MLKMSEMSLSFSLNVMLCMSKMSKMGKEHTHTCLLINFLICNPFSILKSFGKLRLSAFQPYHQILCILKHVKDVKDRSSTLKERLMLCMLCMLKMSKIVKEIKENITHLIDFICQRCQRCT